ncbi:Hypothetical protein, putative [Bodo saltans]|uniref:Uncharacterized protein n=1 Tax=Bodo saltans TaxID=75058 RepID=A0A0S4JRU8_BODSA|nr:Hypothetical protein, putative [Bodo saltans]|eukprot:CUG93510.1 Hypothetical protein, putative [Bodo saltans]
MPSWKSQPRGPIELGEEDVCFDDFMTSLHRPTVKGSAHARAQLDAQQISYSSSADAAPRQFAAQLDYPPSPVERWPQSTQQTNSSRQHQNGASQLQLEQLVFQHQSLIDQLLIELALEREARIALEDRVVLLEDKLQQRNAPLQTISPHSASSNKYTGNLQELETVRSQPAQPLHAPGNSAAVDAHVSSLSLLRKRTLTNRTDIVSPPRRGWSTITEDSMHS